MTAQFDIERLAADFAFKAASEWCRRMQYCHDIWLLADKEYRYLRIDVEAYELGCEWIEICSHITPGSPQADKMAVVDALQPRNP